MQKIKVTSLFSKFTVKGKPFKIITPILLATLLFAPMITPLHALTPARDLTGTWKNGIPEMYYEMDSFDPTMRMNDVSVTYEMIITQTGNSLYIVLNINELSSVTDPAYLSENGPGVPSVGFNQIGFTGTVSAASFTATEIGASTGNAEHIAGTFTTDIITATLTGKSETTDTNGIIVLRSGSSATLPPFVTASPTPTPTPAPAPPTSSNLGTVSLVQGSALLTDGGAVVTANSQIGTGAEIQTGSNGLVVFNYPDNGGTGYLGANSDAGWVYLVPQTDPLSGNVSYVAVPPPAGSFSFSEGIEPDEFGQAGVSLAAEVGVGLVIMAATGAPITLGGAVVVEGTLLLGTGIAYIHEQMSPQEGTCDVRPVQVPQGLVMGAGTDYVVTVSNETTTIQVIEGSVIFIDQYTSNNITVAANQMLTLPSGVISGFSQLDLQSKISAYDASSINQWWIITPVATPITPTDTPAAPTLTAAPTNALTNGSNFLSNPMILALILVIIIVVIVVLIVVLKQKRTSQPRISKRKSRNQTIPPNIETSAAPQIQAGTTQPNGVFCPNCRNQLLDTKGSCPFCNSDLSQWYPNAKK